MQDVESPLSKYALAVTDASHPATSPPEKQWDGQADSLDKPDRSSLEAEEESYGAVVYPDRKAVPFSITQETVNMRMLDGFLHGLPPQDILESMSESMGLDVTSQRVPETDVFVCVSRKVRPAQSFQNKPDTVTCFRPMAQETVVVATLETLSMTLW